MDPSDADELDIEIDRILAGGTTDDPVLAILALLATGQPAVQFAPPAGSSFGPDTSPPN